VKLQKYTLDCEQIVMCAWRCFCILARESVYDQVGCFVIRGFLWEILEGLQLVILGINGHLAC
jgi:hypothetical protein